jgi:hypothetical protein
VAKIGNMMVREEIYMDSHKELKVCPFRKRKERLLSATVEGEAFENEYFMPCMREECPAFHTTLALNGQTLEICLMLRDGNKK